MPRIRSVKPDFWNDEKIGQESESVMLTFIGTWNFSDDYGIVRSNPVWLKNQIFPYKDKLRIDTFSGWLKRLVDLDMVIPFTFNGEGFYCIRNFRKHQKVEKPSKARNCPEDELISIMKILGYEITNEGEFIKQIQNSNGTLPDYSPPDKEGEKDKEKEKDVGAGAKRVRKHSDEDQELFKTFQDWITKYAPRVNQMKEPLTIDEYFKIKKIYSKDVIKKILLAMQNRQDLLKKYVSANLTIKNWSEREIKNGSTGAESEPDKNSVNEKIKAAFRDNGPDEPK